jgi:hypothetical protein
MRQRNQKSTTELWLVTNPGYAQTLNERYRLIMTVMVYHVREHAGTR